MAECRKQIIGGLVGAITQETVSFYTVFFTFGQALHYAEVPL